MSIGSITLRAATPFDIQAVDALLAESYPRLLRPDYPPSVMVTAIPLIARANAALVTSGTYYVAETPEGAIIGAGGWTASRRLRGAAEIRHMVVDWRRQREGIGRRLMATILSEAQQACLTRFEAQATRTAVPFYTALGFEALAQVLVPLRPGIDFPAVTMRRFV